MASPVTVDEALVHLRIGIDQADLDDRVEVERMLEAATTLAEKITRRDWQVTTRTEQFDTFPLYDDVGMYLPGGPVSSITSITYYDSTPAQQTWSASEYRLVTQGGRSYVLPNFGYYYPSDCAGAKANIVVTYATGLAAANVPDAVKSAILLIVGSLYEYREDGVIDNAGLALVKAPIAAKNLLNPYKSSV